METGAHPESTTELLTHILSELTYTPEKLGQEIGTIISYLKLFRKKSGFYPIDPETGLKI